MAREWRAEAGEALEVEENFAGIEVGVLITEEAEVAAVSLGGHRDFPFRMIIIMDEMIEGQFTGFLFEALAKHTVEGEIGGVGRVAEGLVVL